jgi:hypothetical protein
MSNPTTPNPENLAYQKVSVPFQVAWILFGLIWFAIIVQERLTIFNPLEEGAEIVTITPLVCAQFGGNSSFVTTGLYIERFITFDMVNNVFTFVGYIWFKYLPGMLSLENLSKFSFIQGEIIDKSPPVTQMIDKQLLTTFRIRVKLSSLLNYKDFPFDGHKLRITMFHNGFSPDEVLFQSGEQDLVIKTTQGELGWHEVNLNVDAGYMASNMDTNDKRNTQYHPAVTFEIDYVRFGMRLFLIVILPILILLYISIFGFSLDADSAVRNSIGSLTGILSYRFVIDHMSPNVSYFIISDRVFFLIAALAGATLIIHIIALYKIKMTLRLKQLIIITIHLLLNGLSTYFFFM